MNFTVYRSSAGSGKTFTLVKEYLRLALDDVSDPPVKFRRILAITFTNKAAQEMKERVIGALRSLSGKPGEKSETLRRILLETLNISETELQLRSQRLLRNFMAFYNRRLAHLGRERMRKGIFGAHNHGHVWTPRTSFSPDTSAVRILWDGIKVWLKAEITTALAPAGQATPVMMPKEFLAEA